MTKVPSPGFRCGTVAIIGRPNAGKSTLINALMQSEFSATSARAQTTRSNIKGIVQLYTPDEQESWVGQLVLIDTPGVNLRKGLLDRMMYSAIEEALVDVDVAVWVADCKTFESDLDDMIHDRSTPDDRLAVWLKEQLQRRHKKTKWVLVLNKVDTRSKEQLLPLIEKISAKLPEFSEIIPLSALQGIENSRSNVDALLKTLENLIPESAPLYPEEDWTDLNEKALVQNLVREAIFRGSYKEVPYESDCEILAFTEPTGKQRMAEIDANIIVAREALKPILVGKQGSKIKEIGQTVRRRYKEITGDEIVLRLFVKVVDRWNTQTKWLKDLGYDTKDIKEE